MIIIESVTIIFNQMKVWAIALRPKNKKVIARVKGRANLRLQIGRNVDELEANFEMLMKKKSGCNSDRCMALI